jgi:protein-tyrosine kinase
MNDDNGKYYHGPDGHDDGSDRSDEFEGVNGTTHANGTSIARMAEPAMLSSNALEDRRLIHMDMEDPQQVDTFREIRLGLRNRPGNDNPVILVTGVSAGCGTTFVAKNLATAIAFDEARTALLIDCNLRRPQLSREFAVDTSAGGLIEFLHTPAIGLPTIIYPTGVPRLRLIPAGRAKRASGEFLASFRMRALVDVLRNRYSDRALVIDAPPVIGSPDARILAELADTVLLVAGDGMHRPDAINAAARALPANKFGGVIFNHVP